MSHSGDGLSRSQTGGSGNESENISGIFSELEVLKNSLEKVELFFFCVALSQFEYIREQKGNIPFISFNHKKYEEEIFQIVSVSKVFCFSLTNFLKKKKKKKKKTGWKTPYNFMAA